MLSAHDPDAKAKGQWRVLTCLLPRGAVTVIDDWYALGLRGTGSKSVTLDGEFIPDHRIICLQETVGRGTAGQAVNPGPLFRGIPTSTLFTTVITAPALGIAAAAIDGFEERVAGRWNARMRNPQTEWPASQIRLGRATTRLGAARAAFTASIEAFAAQVESGEEMSVEQRTRTRMDMVEVVSTCTGIVYELFLDGGSGAAMDSSPLQRAFRDIHTLRTHFVIGPDPAAENLGRVRLGLDPKPPFI
jgi:3-hydroxy-9,10-secoandrosta-1,3,5(10)-triene-9,17-dione monooxygenase